MYQHPEVIVALIGLIGLCCFFIPFVGFVIQDFKQIKTSYSTISSFSSSPSSWANKFLLCVTFISGYSLVILLLSEARQHLSQWELGLQISLCFGLCFIGICYTDGGRREIYFICGSTRPRIPIWISSLIHSLSALGFMIIMPILHLHFILTWPSFHQSKFLHGMCFFTILDLIILMTFLTLQGVIATPMLISNNYVTRCLTFILSICCNNNCLVLETPDIPTLLNEPCQLCPNGIEHNSELQCNTCHFKFCIGEQYAHDKLCRNPAVTSVVGVLSPIWPSDIKLRSITTNDSLYIASFMLEGCLVVLTLGITAILSLARNDALGWNWL